MESPPPPQRLPGGGSYEKRRDVSLRLEVQRWIELITGQHFDTETELIEALREGVLLCELVNKLKPGIVKKIHSITPVTNNSTASTQNFKKMENIENFRKGCLQLGLTIRDLFNTLDLFEQKDIHSVGSATLPTEWKFLTRYT